MRKHVGVWSLVAVLALVAAACGKDDNKNSSAPAPEGALVVPDDYDTIQDAVDAAKPGDLVYVREGTYKEAVTVTTENIVIRGADRDKTILDGEFEKVNGIFVVDTNGVAVENMTAMNYTKNAFFWSGTKGYRGSYLTSYRTGDYGIYALDSSNGLFEHDYAAGSRDAGFYIGQCNPCNAVIDDVEAEWNGLGYSGTNSSGNLVIQNSNWHDNRAGVVPNSGTGEDLYPQGDNVIVGNWVHDNNNDKTAAIDIAQTAIGNGILIAGGNDNVVERNRVENHDLVGIGVIPLPETVLNPDDKGAKDFDATGNQVIGNDVSGSGLADLAAVTSLGAANDAGGNCFSDNIAAKTLPADIQTSAPCTGTPIGTFTAPVAEVLGEIAKDKPGEVDYEKVELPEIPGDLPNMPDADSAAAQPATDLPPATDPDAVTLPDAGGTTSTTGPAAAGSSTTTSTSTGATTTTKE